ncbi:DUF2277 domain-containing protein [Pseudarthrobacter sp. BRE9]|nr:DUF2277 domain-containing protein [Pseudarthrobacter sp. BRE9]
MCRNIRTLHNFEPHATSEEVHAAALQYVRKVSGSTKPSKANQEAFDEAVHQIAHITEHLLESLVTQAAPKDREAEAAKARARRGPLRRRLTPRPGPAPSASAQRCSPLQFSAGTSRSCAAAASWPPPGRSWRPWPRRRSLG